VKINENCCHYFDKALLASFEVSHLIAKNKTPPTAEETLLIPAAIKICEIMHDEQYSEAFKIIPVPNNALNQYQKT
jgi:hypothetical protein